MMLALVWCVMMFAVGVAVDECGRVPRISRGKLRKTLARHSDIGGIEE